MSKTVYRKPVAYIDRPVGLAACAHQSINQSINVKFVGRRCTTRPGAPTVVSGKHDHKVHS